MVKTTDYIDCLSCFGAVHQYHVNLFKIRLLKRLLTVSAIIVFIVAFIILFAIYLRPNLIISKVVEKARKERSQALQLLD